MITEVSLRTERTRTPSTICFWNHPTVFPPSAAASPGCCLPCWQHLLGCHSLARLSASCVSEQEQQARSHCKCLLEMERPGPVAAAAPFPARAVQRLRGSGFTGDMGRMAHERASQAEPGSASQAKNICVSYLGN